MKRSNFLKSVLTIFAAPSILADISISDTKPVKEYPKEVNEYYFLVSKEMLEDVDYMKYLLENKMSEFHYGAKRRGIDMDKEFNL